jgi:hypothetical protein
MLSFRQQFKIMLEYKIFIKLLVLSFMLIWCVNGHTIQAVVVMYLVVTLCPSIV